MFKRDLAQIIGCCVFHGWNTISENNDQIGYFIHPEHQGHGYASEAIYSIIEIYFSQFPDRNVYAITHPSNLASQKVLDRIGFYKSGTKDMEFYGKKEARLTYCLDMHRFLKIKLGEYISKQ